jgi:hypothetical protein
MTWIADVQVLHGSSDPARRNHLSTRWVRVQNHSIRKLQPEIQLVGPVGIEPTTGGL